MAATGFPFCPCIHTPCALRALVGPPMAVYRAFAVCLACLPCAAGILPRLVLYHGHMTTFTRGVNIHMSIHFTMVTRQHDSTVNPPAWWVDFRQQHCFARVSISGAVVFLQQYVYIVYRRGAARHIGARKLPASSSSMLCVHWFTQLYGRYICLHKILLDKSIRLVYHVYEHIERYGSMGI